MKQTLRIVTVPNSSALGSRLLRASIVLTPEVALEGEPNKIEGSVFADWPDRVRAAAPTLELLSRDSAGVVRRQPIEANWMDLDVQLWRSIFSEAELEASDEQKAPISALRQARNLTAASTERTIRGYDAAAFHSELRNAYSELTWENREQSLESAKTGESGPPPTLRPTDASIRQAFGVFDSRSDKVSTLGNRPGALLQGVKTFWSRGEPGQNVFQFERPAKEFHSLLSKLSSFPVLLRRLGLLLDVAFSPELLTGRTEIAFALNMGAGISVQSLFTRFAMTPEFAPAARMKNPQIVDGMLPIDQAPYDVVQVDLDAAALQLDRYVSQLSDARAALEPMPLPPSLRSGGISVTKRGRAEDAENAEVRREEVREKVSRGEALDAEDLIRGYVVDVQAGSPGSEWKSLCRRIVSVDGRRTDPDDGRTGLDLSVENNVGFVPDSLFMWGGWSLVAPKPARTISQNGTVSGGFAENATPLAQRLSVKAAPGTLPTLRFGQTYRFRVRAQTVAGTDLAEPFVATAGDRHVSKPIVYRRFESVGSPAIIPRERLERYAGESASVLVVRDIQPRRKSDRQVAPPRLAMPLAEAHGMVDRGSRPDPRLYDEIAQRDAVPPIDGSEYEYESELFMDVPWIPDPLAAGFSITGLPGGKPEEFLFGGSGLRRRGWRLRLASGPRGLVRDDDDSTVTIEVAPGRQLQLWISSIIEDDKLALLGMWDWIAPSDAAPSALAPTAASRGQIPLLTPPHELRFVNAVQRPIGDPAVRISVNTALKPEGIHRSRGATNATLQGEISFDRPSTGRLDLIASWQEAKDLLLGGDGEASRQRSQVAEFQPKYGEQPVEPLTIDGTTLEHRLPDTKYRRITYDVVASTRYLEFLPAERRSPELISRRTPENRRTEIDVLSSERPRSPQPRYLIPTFGWTERSITWHSKSKQTTVARERLGGGLRVYLEPPWFSSGPGEQLAVVVLPDADQRFRANPYLELDNGISPFVSQWGMDPLWRSGAIDRALQSFDFVNRQSSASNLLLDGAGTVRFDAAIYDIVADQDRGLYFVDLHIDARHTYTPFVRLALARYQYHSIAGVELSAVVLADIMQLQNGRQVMAMHSKAEPNKLELNVVGVTATSETGLAHELEVVLERKTDGPIGWLPATDVKLNRHANLVSGVLWSASLTFPHKFRHGRYRAKVREFERYGSGSARRLVFSDDLEL